MSASGGEREEGRRGEERGGEGRRGEGREEGVSNYSTKLYCLVVLSDCTVWLYCLIGYIFGKLSILIENC